MRIYWCRFVLILAVFIGGLMLSTTPTRAQTPAAGGVPTPLLLSMREMAFDGNARARIVEDAEGKTSFSEAVYRFRNGQARPLRTPDTSFDAPASGGYWLLLQVTNQHPSKSMWTLNLGRRSDGTVGISDKVILYSDQYPTSPLMTDGRVITHKRHLFGQEKNAIPLVIHPGQTQLLGLYIQPMSGSRVYTSLSIEDRTAFNATLSTYTLQKNFLIGASAFLIFILSIFQAFYRRSIPLILGVYMLAHAALFNASDEIISIGNNTLAILTPLLAALAAAAALMLAKQILQFKKNINNSHWKALRALAIAISMNANLTLVF